MKYKNIKINGFFVVVSILSLILVVISTYHILNFYFWHDDYTHLYKAQMGISSVFPYQIFSFLNPILYRLFGLNPFWYHLFGISIYFVCSLLLYKLLEIIFRNRICKRQEYKRTFFERIKIRIQNKTEMP